MNMHIEHMFISGCFTFALKRQIRNRATNDSIYTVTDVSCLRRKVASASYSLCISSILKARPLQLQMRLRVAWQLSDNIMGISLAKDVCFSQTQPLIWHPPQSVHLHSCLDSSSSSVSILWSQHRCQLLGSHHVEPHAFRYTFALFNWTHFMSEVPQWDSVRQELTQSL